MERRTLLLGSLAVTVSASGLVTPIRPAQAFNISHFFQNAGAALVHGVQVITNATQHIVNVAPKAITNAANLAIQAVTNVAPAASALTQLSADIQQLLAGGPLIQQLPIFANADGLQSVIGTLSDMSTSPIPLDATQQQAAYTQSADYISQNADDLVAQIIKYRANSEYKRFNLPPAVVTPAGMSPSLLGGAVPLPSGISGGGLFPTLMALNGVDLAMGGQGLLSLLALA